MNLSVIQYTVASLFLSNRALRPTMASSRLSYLKCRLRLLDESVGPMDDLFGAIELATSLAVETWITYALGVLLIIIGRIWFNGFKLVTVAARNWSLVCLILGTLLSRYFSFSVVFTTAQQQVLMLCMCSSCTFEPAPCLLRQDASAQPMAKRKAESMSTSRPLPHHRRTLPSSLGSKNGMPESKASQVSRLEA
jgi:hypothetical protein